MRAADRTPRSWLPHPAETCPLDRADPAGLIQRALGGFPTGFCCADQVVLAWLMTLPSDVVPPVAARALLVNRMPSCRPLVAAAADTDAVEVRALLRFIASLDIA